MAIDTKMTDELLLAMLIAQNGRTKGGIVFNQTKSCGLVNWNPATNGESAREQAREAESLRPSTQEEQEARLRAERNTPYSPPSLLSTIGWIVTLGAFVVGIGYLVSRLFAVYTVQSFFSDVPAIAKSFLPLLAVLAVCVIVVKLCNRQS